MVEVEARGWRESPEDEVTVRESAEVKGRHAVQVREEGQGDRDEG